MKTNRRGFFATLGVALIAPKVLLKRKSLNPMAKYSWTLPLKTKELTPELCKMADLLGYRAAQNMDWQMRRSMDV